MTVPALLSVMLGGAVYGALTDQHLKQGMEEAIVASAGCALPASTNNLIMSNLFGNVACSTVYLKALVKEGTVFFRTGPSPLRQSRSRWHQLPARVSPAAP